MPVDTDTAPVDFSLDDLPQALWGYDRKAAHELFGRMSEVHKGLLLERRVLDGLREDMASLSSELDRVREREKALDEQLASGQQMLAAYERREWLLTEMVEAAKQTAAKIRGDARAEATKTLQKARRREPEMIRKANELIKVAEQEAAKVKADALAEAAKAKADALAEAAGALTEANERKAEVASEVGRELDRLEVERQRLQQAADQLREHLSGVFVGTLERIKATIDAETKPLAPDEVLPDVDDEPAGLLSEQPKEQPETQSAAAGSVTPAGKTGVSRSASPAN